VKLSRFYVLLLMFALACEDQGCDGMTPLADPYPTEDLLDDAVVAHMADQGLTELEEIAPSILSAVAGFSCEQAPCPAGDGVCDAENICRSVHDDKGLIGDKIGEQEVNSSAKVCENQCAANDTACEEDFFNKCNVYVQVDEMSFNGTANGDLEMTVLATLFSSVLPISYDLGFLGEGVCDAQINRAQKLITSTITFDNDNPLDRMRVIVGDIDIALDSDDVQLCTLLEAFDSLIWGLLESRVREELDKALDEAMNGLLFETCDASTACPFPELTYCDTANELCRFAGVMAPETNEPMPVPRATGIEGQVALDSFVDQFIKPGSAVDMAIRAKDVSVPAAASGGMAHALNITTMGGFRLPPGDEAASACVPELELATPPSLQFDPPLLTTTGEGYDMVMAVSKNYLNQLAETLRSSGALCQTLDEAVLTGLSSGALSLLLPSLDRITNNESVPLQVDIIPRGSVEMEIGRNLTTEDPANPGRFTLEEPLMGLAIEDMDLDMFLQLPGGWVRFLTVRADLYIDLSLEVTETGGLTLLVGDATNWIQDVTVLNSGLLSESPESLEESLPSLVSVFLPGLLDSMELDFELPAMSGFTFEIDEVAGTNELGTTELGHTGYAFMGIFASMSFDPEGLSDGAFGLASGHSLISWAALKSVSTPDADQWREGDNVRIQLQVGATNAQVPADSLVSWVKVNDGPFHPLYRGDEITIIDPVLNRPGEHDIHIHTAIADMPGTRDPVGTTITVNTQILPSARATDPTPIVEGGDINAKPNRWTARDEVATRTEGTAWSCDSSSLANVPWWAMGLVLLWRRRKRSL